MRPLPLTAFSAVTGFGPGLAPLRAALREGRSALAPDTFSRHGHPKGYIARLAAADTPAALLPPALARFACRAHALLYLALSADGFAEALARARARWGAGRIALVLGTSTSGIIAAEEAYAARDETGRLPESFDFAHTQDFAAPARLLAACTGIEGPALVLSAACASTAQCFGAAAELIAAGFADAAVVGGADSLCQMTLAGFGALGLIAPRPCRPFDRDREGISIGEGAALFLLERDGAAPFYLLGYGESSDGYHMSAPHPEGAGARRAMEAALAAAGLEPEAIDYLNLHGTATPANDAAEDRAVAALFGPRVTASATKGFTGHTLGAAGAIEAAITLIALEEGFVPPTLFHTTPDPALLTPIVTRPESRPLRRAMSNSFGFGGANCSLVLGRAA